MWLYYSKVLVIVRCSIQGAFLVLRIHTSFLNFRVTVFYIFIFASEPPVCMLLMRENFICFWASSLELEKAEFLLGSVIDAVVSQVMLLLRKWNLQLIHDSPEGLKSLAVYGDQVRIQQVLADSLLNLVHCAPSAEGWLEIHVPSTEANLWWTCCCAYRIQVCHPCSPFCILFLNDVKYLISKRAQQVW